MAEVKMPLNQPKTKGFFNARKFTLNSEYQTKKGQANVQKQLALSSKESPESRAKAQKKYEKLVKEIEALKQDLAQNERERTKFEAQPPKYDKEQGKKDVEEYKKQYQFLSDALDAQADKNSPEAKSIKKDIESLSKKYQDAYSNAVGTRVSLGVAKTSLEGRKVPTLTGTAAKEKPIITPDKKEIKTTPDTKKEIKTTDTKITGDATKDKIADKDKKDKVKPKTAAELRAEALDVGRESDFTLPETIFNNVPSLKILIDKYSDPKSKMTEKQFRKELRDDVWFRKNSLEIKNRYIQLYNYEDLVKTGQIDPKKPGNTEYEKQIATLTRQLTDKARAMGSAAASDPEAIKKAVSDWYITNVDINDPMVNDFLAASIKPIFSRVGGAAGYSGEALKNYQTLQATAKANGFKISDIIPGGFDENKVLEGVAKGTIDINRVAQDARRLAMQGQPQYVRDLLDQGYNLDQVYAPYRQTMATILEIQDPNEIDLNDATLRSAITDKGDMNLYDFKKALKKDQRWQYTENARTEIADTTLKVLRDFGFQG